MASLSRNPYLRGRYADPIFTGANPYPYPLDEMEFDRYPPGESPPQARAAPEDHSLTDEMIEKAERLIQQNLLVTTSPQKHRQLEALRIPHLFPDEAHDASDHVQLHVIEESDAYRQLRESEALALQMHHHQLPQATLNLAGEETSHREWEDQTERVGLYRPEPSAELMAVLTSQPKRLENEPFDESVVPEVTESVTTPLLQAATQPSSQAANRSVEDVSDDSDDQLDRYRNDPSVGFAHFPQGSPGLLSHRVLSTGRLSQTTADVALNRDAAVAQMIADTRRAVHDAKELLSAFPPPPLQERALSANPPASSSYPHSAPHLSDVQPLEPHETTSGLPTPTQHRTLDGSPSRSQRSTPTKGPAVEVPLESMVTCPPVSSIALLDPVPAISASSISSQVISSGLGAANLVQTQQDSERQASVQESVRDLRSTPSLTHHAEHVASSKLASARDQRRVIILGQPASGAYQVHQGTALGRAIASSSCRQRHLSRTLKKEVEWSGSERLNDSVDSRGSSLLDDRRKVALQDRSQSKRHGVSEHVEKEEPSLSDLSCESDEVPPPKKKENLRSDNLRSNGHNTNGIPLEEHRFLPLTLAQAVHQGGSNGFHTAPSAHEYQSHPRSNADESKAEVNPDVHYRFGVEARGKTQSAGDRSLSNAPSSPPPLQLRFHSTPALTAAVSPTPNSTAKVSSLPPKSPRRSVSPPMAVAAKSPSPPREAKAEPSYLKPTKSWESRGVATRKSHLSVEEDNHVHHHSSPETTPRGKSDEHAPGLGYHSATMELPRFRGNLDEFNRHAERVLHRQVASGRMQGERETRSVPFAPSSSLPVIGV